LRVRKGLAPLPLVSFPFPRFRALPPEMDEPWKVAVAAVGGVAALLLLVGIVQRCRNSYSFKGKVVVITGGSSGIGKAIAKVRRLWWPPRRGQQFLPFRSSSLNLVLSPQPLRPHGRPRRSAWPAEPALP
jgi:hypothetical protein